MKVIDIAVLKNNNLKIKYNDTIRNIEVDVIDFYHEEVKEYHPSTNSYEVFRISEIELIEENKIELPEKINIETSVPFNDNTLHDKNIRFALDIIIKNQNKILDYLKDKEEESKK